MNIDELNTQLDYLAETKEQIKSAITNKGQEIISDTPFREYVEKINNISTLQADTSDANAIAEDILINKTAYVNGQKITGTLPLFPNTSTFTVSNAGVNNNIEDSTLDLTTINTTKQILDSNVSMNFNADYSDVAAAIGLTADKIVEGNTILGIEGTATTGTTADITIPQAEYGLEIATSGEGDNDTGFKFYTNANTQSKLYNVGSIVELHITNELLAQILGITADKIKKDEVICGITGTYEATVEAQEQIETLTQENQTLNTTINDSNELAEDILGITTN